MPKVAGEKCQSILESRQELRKEAGFTLILWDACRHSPTPSVWRKIFAISYRLDHPWYARLRVSMSNFFILRKACVTRATLLRSLSRNISSRTVGTICHERPNLSLSQPHCSAFGSADNLAQ